VLVKIRAINFHSAYGLSVISTLLFFITATLYVVVGARPTGDEPHYLILSQALLKYHSFDVSLVYAHGDYRVFYDRYLDPHVVMSPLGMLVPNHSPGGPILWLIPFFLFGRLGVVWFIAALSVLIILNIYWLLLALRVQPRVAFLVSLFFAVASPIYLYAHLAFIEPIAALACVYVLRKCIEGDVRIRTLLLSSFLLGILPWLHIRFAPILIVLFLAQGYRLCRVYGVRRWLPYLWYLLPLVLLFLALEVYNWRMLGTLNPLAGRLYARDRIFERWPFEGLFGVLFDQSFGLLISFPLCFFLIAGLVLALRDRSLRFFNVLALLLIGPYLLAFTTFRVWFAGYSPPVRYFLVVLPMCAVYLAYALERIDGRLVRRFLQFALVWGFLYNTVSMFPPRNGFNDPEAYNAILDLIHLGGFDLAQYLPSLAFPNLLCNVIWLVGYSAFSIFVVQRGLRNSEQTGGEIHVKTGTSGTGG
jgi:hypothetical protein